MEQSRGGGNQAATVGGIVLVGLGLVFLVQQGFGIDIGHYGWPIFIILPGLAMLAGFALGPRSASGLAIPGCVVTATGLILAVQNTLDIWQTWAYAWALIPASVGLGMRLMGERLGRGTVIRVGTQMLEGGLVAFVVFAVFFEFVIGLSHLATGPLRSIIGPALLIVVGLYLLMRRRPSPSSGVQ